MNKITLFTLGCMLWVVTTGKAGINPAPARLQRLDTGERIGIVVEEIRVDAGTLRIGIINLDETKLSTATAYKVFISTIEAYKMFLSTAETIYANKGLNTSTLTLNSDNISLGNDTYDNYDYGIGLGYNAYGNYYYGIGLGWNSFDNHNFGIGVGGNSFNNHESGIGIGHGTQNYYNYGIGIGSSSQNNYVYGVGIGYNSLRNHNYGIGIGFDSEDNSDYGIGIGETAKNNYTYGIGIGKDAGYNFNSGIGIGYKANSNNNFGIGIGGHSSYNESYGIGIGWYSRAKSSSVAIGKDAKANAPNSVALGAGAVNDTPNSVAIPVGWDFNINGGELIEATVSTNSVNDNDIASKKYVDDEINASTTTGGGTADEYIALLEGLENSQIYESSDTLKTGGNWQGVYGSSQKIYGIDFVDISISSTAPTGVSVGAKLVSGDITEYTMRTLDSSYTSDFGIYIWEYGTIISTQAISAGTTYYNRIQ
jgi:hypothetical protein